MRESPSRKAWLIFLKGLSYIETHPDGRGKLYGTEDLII
jgi:hypothetical protein